MSARVAEGNGSRLTVGMKTLLGIGVAVLAFTLPGPSASAEADATASPDSPRGSLFPETTILSGMEKGFTPPQLGTYTCAIYGVVVGYGSGIQGVLVSAGNGGGSCTTGKSGSYGLVVPYGWSGDVTPLKNGWAFDPPHKHFNHVTDLVIDGVNFHGTLTGRALAGLVRTPDGAAVPDVTVSAEIGGSATTDASGAYELRVDDGWSGVVTPSKPHWIFTPPARNYNNVTADQSEQNYSGLPNGRTLSGSIRTGDGSVVAGVKVTANNGGGTGRTDEAGVYIVTVPGGWSGVVLPSMDRCAFGPPSRSYSNVAADQSEQNYTVTPRSPALFGTARTAEGAGIPGVTILANNGGGSATTDASGAYSLIVPDRWSGTVMSFKAGYEFTPLSRDYFTVMSDQANQNYTGKPAATIYVDAGARGKNDGTSWANAFVYLQDALAKALPGDALRVAEGWYWPDLGGGQNIGDRTATFQLRDGLVLYGGFPTGGGEGAQRNLRAHQTVLSGDIGKPGVAMDNSYHVVSANGLSIPVLLDGCVIAGGHADVAQPAPRRDQGAGLYSVQSRLQVRNCIFVGNLATSQGGGAYTAASDVMFVNCLFTGNSGSDGGALYNEPGTVALINCTVVANQGFWRASVARPTTVVNSILWGNPGRPNRTAYDDLAQLSGALPPAVNFCCVEGWSKSLGAEGALTGKSNLDSDPLFVQAAGADGIAGTLDDDLRLQAGSPCLDQGDNTAVPPEILTDLEGRPRILNRVVDLGAYESGTVAANP